MSTSDRHAWLTLYNTPGLGPAAISALIGHFGSPERVLSASFNHLCARPGVGQITARSILTHRSDAWATDQIQRAEASGISIITCHDAAYPANLKQIYAPPPLLFALGDMSRYTPNAIAIVGSRAITAYGRDIARRLAHALAAQGMAVVSGMAVGIDTQAHRAALEASGTTVAVLGSGLDRPYPPENRRLFRDICTRGLALSEFPMGTGPEAHNFPRRNRIISGLSLGTVVVEAGRRSGALITAQYALEQNRDVFAVPGPIYSGKSQGTNRLIQQGAMLVRDIDDILHELQPHLAPQAKPAPGTTPQPDLNGAQKRVWEALCPDAHKHTHIDDIAQKAGLPTTRVLECLLELQLEGYIEQSPGMRFRRRT